MPDEKVRGMHNIFARNNQARVIYEEMAYRRDTAKPRKTYMKKRARLSDFTRFFSLP
jgi:hypothetical protein